MPDISLMVCKSSYGYYYFSCYFSPIFWLNLSKIITVTEYDFSGLRTLLLRAPLKMHWVNLVIIDCLPISSGGGKGGWLAKSQHLVILNEIYGEYSFVALSISIYNFKLHIHAAQFLSTIQEKNNTHKKWHFLAFLVLVSTPGNFQAFKFPQDNFAVSLIVLLIVCHPCG